MKGIIAIGIIGLSTFLYWMFSYEGPTNMENELIMSNVEALTQSDYNPNVAYNYQMVNCYENETIGHQTIPRLVGAKCQPCRDRECVRSMQWGKCP